MRNGIDVSVISVSGCVRCSDGGSWQWRRKGGKKERISEAGVDAV